MDIDTYREAQSRDLRVAASVAKGRYALLKYTFHDLRAIAWRLRRYATRAVIFHSKRLSRRLTGRRS